VIQSFVFVVDVQAVAGEQIEVVNHDGADHTLTAEDGSFEAYVQADGAAVLTIDRPGTYAVWCRIHPDMRATVVVAPVP
jgi:plastocyanin